VRRTVHIRDRLEPFRTDELAVSLGQDSDVQAGPAPEMVVDRGDIGGSVRRDRLAIDVGETRGRDQGAGGLEQTIVGRFAIGPEACAAYIAYRKWPWSPCARLGAF